MVSFSEQTYSKRLLLLISWGHWFTFFNIVAAIALSSIYLFTESFPETLLGQTYLITNWISHIAFLVFMSFMLILFPLILIFPNTKFIRTAASIVYTAILLSLLLDVYVYSQLGYHLNASSASQIGALISSLIEDNTRLFWSISLILCMVLLSFQFVASNYAWKHLRNLQKTKFSDKIIIGLVSAFCFSHIVHIWADTELNYDILRQDSFLPLTYPATAKTLLTKYNMFDKKDYIERKTAPLSFTDSLPSYPVLVEQCQANVVNQSIFVVLTDEILTEAQIDQVRQRSGHGSITLNEYVDNAELKNAWFNLLYGLPSIYREEILNQGTEPVLFQAARQLDLMRTITVIDKDGEFSREDNWYEELFSDITHLEDISSLTDESTLNEVDPGIHFVYFADSTDFQFELFMDALLLSQRQKAEKNKDIIWVSSLGNKTSKDRFIRKPAFAVLPSQANKAVNEVVGPMDFSATIIDEWLNCTIESKAHSNGSSITKIKNDRIMANTSAEGIIVYSKDKAVLIDQNGNFQSYSQQLETPIVINADFPLMIDGVHFIRQFATLNKSVDKSANESKQ